jgi:hypothetical protein
MGCISVTFAMPVALWIAAGANPKQVSVRAGHASVSFTLDHYGHLFPEADEALRDRLDAFYVAGGPAPAGTVVQLPPLTAVAPTGHQTTLTVYRILMAVVGHAIYLL